jgi:hypothetical protein
MLRTSGSGDDKKPAVGDIRLFVTKETEKFWQYSIGRRPRAVETDRPLPHP